MSGKPEYFQTVFGHETIFEYETWSMNKIKTDLYLVKTCEMTHCLIVTGRWQNLDGLKIVQPYIETEIAPIIGYEFTIADYLLIVVRETVYFICFYFSVADRDIQSVTPAIKGQTIAHIVKNKRHFH